MGPFSLWFRLGGLRSRLRQASRPRSEETGWIILGPDPIKPRKILVLHKARRATTKVFVGELNDLHQFVLFIHKL